MEARRKKQGGCLADQQAAETAKHLAAQQQERDALNNRLAKEIEDTQLKESIKDMDNEQAEKAVHILLRQKHMKEAVHLEDQLERDRRARIAAARAEVQADRAEGREKIVAAYEQELRELMANAGSMSKQELEQKKAELKQKHQQRLKDYDRVTAQLVDQAEKDIIPKIEIDHTYQRLALKEKQMKELADALRNLLSPGDAMVQRYQEEAEQAEREAAEYRETKLKEMQAELERQKEALRRKKEEQERKMAEQLSQLESDLEADRKRDEERERQRQAERERTRQQQMDDRNQRELEEINQMNISEQERNRLMQQHEANKARLEENLRKDQSRSHDALQAKLEARRRRKQELEGAIMERDAVLGEEEERKRELLQRMQDEADQNMAPGTTASTLAAGMRGAGDNTGTPGQQPSTGPFPSSGGSEQDWVNMLMASPLFKQINDLQDMVEKNAGKGLSSHVLGADYSRPYIDVKDAQWSIGGDLRPVDLNSISPSQFVIYRFGVFVIKLLHQTNGTPEVTLLLASNLPQNNYERNCFRNSFFYEHARKILFVRQERMSSIGDFVVLILHSLAHIQVDDLTDDANPLFLRQFYKALRMVCQDMFFSRTHKTAASESIMGSSNSGRAGLESAFQVTKTSDEKANMVGELVDMKVDGPTRLDFSEEAMGNRVQGYETFASNARLRQLLSADGGINHEGDFVGARLSELKGQKPTTEARGRKPKSLKRPGQVSSKRDILNAQLNDLESRCDGLNTELSQVLSSESNLRDGIEKMELAKSATPADQLEAARDQLTSLLLRKENLMKHIALVETDIATKQREIKKAK